MIASDTQAVAFYDIKRKPVSTLIYMLFVFTNIAP